jgi:hypothetical protein
MRVNARAFGRTDSSTSRSVQCTANMFRTYLDVTDHQILQTSGYSCPLTILRKNQYRALRSGEWTPSSYSVPGKLGIHLFSTSPMIHNILGTPNWTHTVAYRPVAKQNLCKQRPFLGNCSLNTFRCNEYARNNSYCWKLGVFYVVRAVTAAM